MFWRSVNHVWKLEIITKHIRCTEHYISGMVTHCLEFVYSFILFVKCRHEFQIFSNSSFCVNIVIIEIKIANLRIYASLRYNMLINTAKGYTSCFVFFLLSVSTSETIYNRMAKTDIICHALYDVFKQLIIFSKCPCLVTVLFKSW